VERSELELEPGLLVPLYTVSTLIIGSGAAGLNCAEHLIEFGAPDVLVVTERLGGGTSANSGSDKQTYYKIGVFGDVADSPMEFARTLTAGGMMHGDLAYIEGLNSLPEFYHLVRNGVPFPHNRYGAFVGYKTDHDPRHRATSAGPKTSWLMVRGALEALRRHGVPILDRHQVIRLLTVPGRVGVRVIGAVGLDLSRLSAPGHGLVVFSAENVVLATGGPGELYSASVYPPGQAGGHGLALEIGVVANNLTELQFGLASTRFRWNVSGTYQQVVPSYVSVAADGSDRREFLLGYFDRPGDLATATFLKGYQWPFHAERTQGCGSSLVDVAVWMEEQSGRHVFVDFGRNAAALELLAPEAREYLIRSGAYQPTPLERLAHMNPAAVAVYEEHGVDLREPLEVTVCAQHCNGGLRGDIWWETSVPHLFAIGEVNGSHGVRPGGSALNAGQVGGLRVAQRIGRVYRATPLPPHVFEPTVMPQLRAALDRIRWLMAAGEGAPSPGRVRREIQARMTAHGAFLRSASGLADAVNGARLLLHRIRAEGQRLASVEQLATAVENEHLCLTHLALLQTMKAYVDAGGGSRGSCMVLDPAGDRTVRTPRGQQLRHRSENLTMRAEILETRLKAPAGVDFEVVAIPTRPLPDDTSWYETTWREFEAGRVFEDEPQVKTFLVPKGASPL